MEHVRGTNCSPFSVKENCQSFANLPSTTAKFQSTSPCGIISKDPVEQENQRLRNQLINEQENALAWERECQRITEQGKLLYSSYIARCNRLKHTTTQLEQMKAKSQGMEEACTINQQKYKAELEEWKHKYMDLAGRFKQNFTFYKELEAEHDSLKSEHAVVIEASNQSSKDLKEVQGQLRESQKKTAHLEQVVHELEGQLSSLRMNTQMVAVNAELYELRRLHEELQGRCLDCQKEKQTAIQAKLAAEDLVASISKERDELLVRLEVQQSLVNDYQHQTSYPTGNDVFSHPEEQRPTLGNMESINITNELLREENVNLQKEIATLEESKGALQASISDHELQIEQLQNIVQQKDERIALLTSTVEEASYQTQAMDSNSTNEIKDLYGQIEVLNQSLSVSHCEIERLRKTNLNMEESLREAVEAVKKAEGRNASLEQQQEELMVVNKKMQDDMRLVYRKHKKEVETLAQQFKHDDYKARYAQVALEKMVLQSKQENLHAMARDIENLFDLNQAIVGSQQEAMAELRLRVHSSVQWNERAARRLLRLLALQQQHRQDKLIIQQLREQLGTHEEKCRVLESAIEDKASTIARLTKSMQGLATQLEAARSTLRCQAEQTVENSKQISLLQQELASARNEAEALLRQRDDQSVLAEQSGIRLQETTKELFEVRGILAAVEERQESFSLDLARVQEERQQLEHENARLREKLAQQQNDALIRMNQQKEEFSVTLSELTKEKEDLLAEIDANSSLVNFAELEHSVHQDTIASHVRKLSSLQELVSELTGKEGLSKERVQAAEKHIAELEQNLERQLESNQRLEEQLKQVQDRHLSVVQALEAQQNLAHMAETASQQSLMRLRAMAARCDSLVLHNRRLLCEIQSLTNRLHQADKIYADSTEQRVDGTALQLSEVLPSAGNDLITPESSIHCTTTPSSAHVERRVPLSPKPDAELQTRTFPTTPVALNGDGHNSVAQRIQQLRQQCREILAAQTEGTTTQPGQLS